MQTSTQPPLFSADDLEAVSVAFFDEAHLEQTARSIVRLISRRLRAHAASLLMADAAGCLHLMGVYKAGELVPPEILDAGPNSLAVRASLTRTPAAIMIGPDDSPIQAPPGESAGSALAVPLLAGSELQGVLVLCRRRPFARRDLRALRHVAHHVALGMRYARMEARLAEQPRRGYAEDPERALQEFDHLKAEFIAGVSHELRTPLHHIKGYSSALLRRDLRVTPEEIREFLEIIDQESDKLALLIDDLLDTSRIEAGVVAVEMQRMDLATILHRTVDNARKMASDHEFVLNGPADLPGLEADPRRIEQVLTNLLGNASKYSPPGTTITIGAASTPEEIIVSIQDQGEGISSEHLAHIFEPFYRIPRERERRVSGNGLGLFICRGLIEAHGGTIWAESRPDEGTRLSFTLPRHRPGRFHG